MPIPPIGAGHRSTQYDVTPDGEAVHFVDMRSDPAPKEVGMVLGWRALVR